MASKITQARNSIAQLMLHLLLIFIVLWVCGFCVAYATKQSDIVGFNLTPIQILYNWSVWIFQNWNLLHYYDYNYIKIKIGVAIFLPISIAA
jgi:hypothetical protein